MFILQGEFWVHHHYRQYIQNKELLKDILGCPEEGSPYLGPVPQNFD